MTRIWHQSPDDEALVLREDNEEFYEWDDDEDYGPTREDAEEG